MMTEAGLWSRILGPSYPVEPLVALERNTSRRRLPSRWAPELAAIRHLGRQVACPQRFVATGREMRLAALGHAIPASIPVP